MLRVVQADRALFLSPLWLSYPRRSPRGADSASSLTSQTNSLVEAKKLHFQVFFEPKIKTKETYGCSKDLVDKIRGVCDATSLPKNMRFGKQNAAGRRHTGSHDTNLMQRELTIFARLSVAKCQHFLLGGGGGESRTSHLHCLPPAAAVVQTEGSYIVA